MVHICPKGCVYRLFGTIRIRAGPDDDVCHQSLALASVNLCHATRFFYSSHCLDYIPVRYYLYFQG